MSALVYLASPYSHPSEEKRIARFHAACRAAALLMCEGDTVFSPIAHSHPVAMELADKYTCDTEFWLRQDLPILSKCDKMVILKLEGWDQSKGVAREAEFATLHGIPIEYMDPV